MSDTPEYILKRPISAKHDASISNDSAWVYVSIDGKEIDECLSFENFKALFVPLDIPAIEKQLDQIIKDSVDLGALLLHAQVKKELTLDECVERQKVQISDAVNQIKSLFGLENKETDDA